MKKQILIESVNANLSEREFNQAMAALRANSAKIASNAVLEQFVQMYINQQIAPLFRFEGQFAKDRQQYIANKVQEVVPQIQTLFKNYVSSELQEYVNSDKFLFSTGVQLVGSNIC